MEGETFVRRSFFGHATTRTTVATAIAPATASCTQNRHMSFCFSNSQAKEHLRRSCRNSRILPRSCHSTRHSHHRSPSGHILQNSVQAKAARVQQNTRDREGSTFIVHQFGDGFVVFDVA